MMKDSNIPENVLVEQLSREYNEKVRKHAKKELCLLHSVMLLGIGSYGTRVRKGYTKERA